jgi:formylglycine-generating enzyme required for sulfatase activity
LGRLHGLPGDESGFQDPRFSDPHGLPSFVEIPAGAFWMGSTEEEIEHWIKKTGKERYTHELPRHRVYLDAYEVARYPTTNAMYAHFIDDRGYGDGRWWEEAIADGYWKAGRVKNWLDDQWYAAPRYWNDARWNNPSQPVVGVSWYEAVAYCRWLTARDEQGYLYRLPTEAEWERAARGPEGRIYPWGDRWVAGACNSEEVGLEESSPVGIFPQGATREGLDDMVGNVWEWCRDWYAKDAYARSAPRNPTGPDNGKTRVLRGGSWYNVGPSVCRCGYRDRYNPWNGLNDWGFRCVRTLSSAL